MTRPFAYMILSAILTGGAFTQTTAAPAVFEAADVRTSAKAPNAYMTAAFRGGRYEIRKATMLDLIRVAYGIDNYKILGGP
jgi:hypothetical protein